MEKFIKHTGKCIPLFQANIDTDQIVPKKFLLSVERTGYDRALFYDWRFHSDGTPKEEFIFNDDRYRGATILLAGENFGCGSSREHAPWALAEYGFRVIIAPSFADIFYNNCFNTGILAIKLNNKIVEELVAISTNDPEFQLTIDLENQSLKSENTINETFQVDEFRKFNLVNGLDEIGLTLQYSEEIARFENSRVNAFLS